MKQLRLTETCTQYTQTRNRYGDIVLVQVGTIKCLFRDITTLNRGVNFREEVQVDGIFWFAPDATVKQGDIIDFGGTKYRLEQQTIAKARLTDNSTHFLKFSASILRQVS